MDQNNPARFLDTAYNALKANPNATGQILQAAAQGQPVGLRGLAAAAAQQNQQEAQKAAMAQNIRGPQPSVIQQLAGASGIMGQLPSNLQLASAPTGPAPEEMPPQMMAGGGLVAFAGGGNVLPPDVIDAIQSHFAEGGDVGLSDFERRHPEVIGDTIGSRWGDVLASHAQTDKDILGTDVLGDIADRWRATLGHHAQTDRDVLSGIANRWKDTIGHHVQTDKDVLGPIVDRWKAMHASHLKNSDDFSRGLKQTWEESTSPIGGPIDRTPMMSESDYRLLEEKGAFGPKPPNLLDKISGYLQSQTPKATADAVMEDQVGASTPTEQDLSALDRLTENYPRNGILAATKEPSKRVTKGSAPATPTWKADSDPHTGTPATPKAIVHTEGQKLDKTFDQAKVDTGTKTTDQAAQQGLDSLDQGREAVDYIKSLLGEKKLSPEISQKLADLEDKARTSTIIQSVLGGIAGGLSNPYGGRFALGSAALNALGGYQKGIGSEEDIQRKALDIQRAYADQPAEMQTAAAKEFFDLTKEKMRGLNAERIAEGKSESALDRLLRSEEGKYLRAQIMSGQKGDVTEGQKLTAWNQAREQAAKEIKDAYIGTTPPEGELERRTQQHYIAALNSILAATGGLGAGQAQQQQYGLGAQPTGRSIIGGKLTGSSPQ